MLGPFNDDQWVDQCQRQNSTEWDRATLSKISNDLRAGDLEKAFIHAKETSHFPEDHVKLLNFILDTKVQDDKKLTVDNNPDIGPVSESVWAAYAAARLVHAPNKEELEKIDRLSEQWDRNGKEGVLESASMGDYQKGNGVALAEVIVQTTYDRDEEMMMISKDAPDWANCAYGPNDFEEVDDDEDYEDEDN